MNRLAPLLGFVLLTAAALLGIERSRLSDAARLPVGIFLVIVLGAACLRNYQPPAFAERNLGRPAAIGTAVVLSLAVSLLVVVFAARFLR